MENRISAMFCFAYAAVSVGVFTHEWYMGFATFLALSGVVIGTRGNE